MKRGKLQKDYIAYIGDAWWLGRDYYQKSVGGCHVNEMKKESLRVCSDCNRVYEVKLGSKRLSRKAVVVYFFSALCRRGLVREICPSCDVVGSSDNVVIVEG